MHLSVQIAIFAASHAKRLQPTKGIHRAATRAMDLLPAILNAGPVPGPPTGVGTLKGNVDLPKTLSAAFPASDVPLDDPGVRNLLVPEMGWPAAIASAATALSCRAPGPYSATPKAYRHT